MVIPALSTSPKTVSSEAGSSFSAEKEACNAPSPIPSKTSFSSGSSTKPGPEIVNRDAKKLSGTSASDRPPEHGKLERKSSSKPRMFFPDSLPVNILAKLSNQQSGVPFPNSSFPTSAPPSRIRAASTKPPVSSSSSSTSQGFSGPRSLRVDTEGYRLSWRPKVRKMSNLL